MRLLWQYQTLQKALNMTDTCKSVLWKQPMRKPLQLLLMYKPQRQKNVQMTSCSWRLCTTAILLDGPRPDADGLVGSICSSFTGTVLLVPAVRQLLRLIVVRIGLTYLLVRVLPLAPAMQFSKPQVDLAFLRLRPWEPCLKIFEQFQCTMIFIVLFLQHPARRPRPRLASPPAALWRTELSMFVILCSALWRPYGPQPPQPQTEPRPAAVEPSNASISTGLAPSLHLFHQYEGGTCMVKLMYYRCYSHSYQIHCIYHCRAPSSHGYSDS